MENTVKVELSVRQITNLVNYLQGQYDSERYAVNRSFDTDNDITDWQVHGAKTGLKKRDEIMNLIASLTGVFIDDEFETHVWEMEQAYENQLAEQRRNSELATAE